MLWNNSNTGTKRRSPPWYFRLASKNSCTSDSMNCASSTVVHVLMCSFVGYSDDSLFEIYIRCLLSCSPHINGFIQNKNFSAIKHAHRFVALTVWPRSLGSLLRLRTCREVGVKRAYWERCASHPSTPSSEIQGWLF